MLSRQFLRTVVASNNISHSAAAAVAASSSSSSVSVCCFAGKSSSNNFGLLRSSPLLRLKYERLDDGYFQESFEALQRFENSTTYPGSIMAATPGDTAVHMGRFQTLLEEGDKHYWRAVVDDPEPRRYATIRIRFKEEVCVGDSFEVHNNVIPVSVPVDSTVAYLMQATQQINDSPYLCQNPFTLSLNGKVLHSAQTLKDAGITENTVLDAADDVRDHRMHEEGVRMLDWYRDEMTPEVENTAPYAELKLRENTVVPRMSPRAYRMYGKPPLARHGVPHGSQANRIK